MILCFVFSSRRRHTRCALVTGVQTCALPILLDIDDARTRIEADREAAQARLTRYIAENEPVAQGAAPLADVDLIELRRTLESNPGIILADTAEQRARAAIDLARADKRPDFGVNVSLGRRNPDFGNVVSVMGSVTLPIFAGRQIGRAHV